jgi:hypothetical protein
LWPECTQRCEKKTHAPEGCLVREGHPGAGVEVVDKEGAGGQRLLGYGGQLGAPHAVARLVALRVSRVKFLEFKAEL